MPKHPSDSQVQQVAESEIIQKVGLRLGCLLRKKSFSVGTKYLIQIDGYSDRPMILCEAFARIGKLRPAQEQKVSADILKMLLLEKQLGGRWRKVYAFVDEHAAKPFLANTWHSVAASIFGVEVLVVTLEPETRNRILDAQKQQKMKNDHIST